MSPSQRRSHLSELANVARRVLDADFTAISRVDQADGGSSCSPTQAEPLLMST